MLDFSVLKCGALEAVAEEESVIFYRVAPICPVVSARTDVELVRNAFFHQLFVKIAVDLKEEIICTAVKYYVQ